MLQRLSCVTVAVCCFGCAARSSYVHSDAALGRVVVYRNGVAYFERYAEVEGDSLSLAVPADKVDDFLKSLTVVDATTRKPAPVAYPTADDHDKSSGNLIDMKIQLGGQAPHKLFVTYVTEAPAWKPSYRVVLGDGGQVSLQALAIVDNTSGEDWNGVKLGVGASSALSFRYDLRSIRSVQREQLAPSDVFAQAPPTGGSTYTTRNEVSNGDRDGDGILDTKDADTEERKKIVLELRDDELSSADASGEAGKSKPRDARPIAPNTTGNAGARGVPRDPVSGQHAVRMRDLDQRVAELKESVRRSHTRVIVEGLSASTDGDEKAAALERANRVRERLLREGVAPDRVVAVAGGRGEQGRGGVRVLEDAEDQAFRAKARLALLDESVLASRPSERTDPIGVSHFESQTPMSVPRGTSAMISILDAKTEGEVVYLYDAESPRGNARFPFRSVRLKNPSANQLEPGPVSVFGNGRFIGEGVCDPIPPRATAFVPFALDRQIVVERKDGEEDRIARILSVQRGVLRTEVQHVRRATFTLHNRLSERAVVYVRHTVPKGWALVSAPPKAERVGDAHLFRIELAPDSKSDVTIEEATPIQRTADLRSPDGLGLVRAYVSSAAAEGPLRDAMRKLVDASAEVGNLEQQLATAREQLGEYRQRMDELASQLVALKAVKAREGVLVATLEKKLQEVNERVSQATLSVVALQEKLMVARIRFQDGVAELSLDGQPPAKTSQAAPN